MTGAPAIEPTQAMGDTSGPPLEPRMSRTTPAILALALVLASGCATQAGNARRDDMPAATAARAPIAVPAIRRPQEETAAWWFRAGAAAAHERGADQARARNVILFVGDGMSLTTVAAARIFDGQRRGQPGEENALSFERFGHTALSKTYNTDSQTPDSAGTMTAMITGSKTGIGMLGVGQSRREPCGAPIASLLEVAEGAGLATGVVTTTRLTHATPGATYGHSPERGWEVDIALSPEARAAGCRDLARQFVEFDVGDGIDVAFGGGRRMFLPASVRDPEYADLIGRRGDGRDLVAEWRKRHPDGRFVWNARDFAALDLARPGPVLGLFEPDHMQFEHERAAARTGAGEPSLAEMTRAALTVLKRDADGFMLLVEGGRIDHAHHYGNAYRALDETVAMAEAVRVATELTSEDDTLILVTADHAHTLTFAGYPQRGNPILGKVVGLASEGGGSGAVMDALGLPYTTLGYANGTGYAGASDLQPAGPKHYPHQAGSFQAATGRPDLRDVDTTDPDYLQEVAIPLGDETHGGEDVGIWARGPGSDAVRGTVEQNVIFHFLLQASPRLREYLCARTACEQGVPVAPVAPEALAK
jgi:alkaline phosphatase